VLDLFDGGASHVAALDWVDETLGHYSWVHTINNAALIAIGLLWGRDFAGAVAIAISGGRDTDSTAATVGSAYGALHGAESVPAGLVGTTHHRVRSDVRDFDRVPVGELAERTLRLARADA
jgi:ADP-ribosylglycohydrolase